MTKIEIHSSGHGPGLVVVHGSGVSWGDYRRLARALADRFTVHLYNRRGRPGAPEFAIDHSLDDDIADLSDVLDATGASYVFGHSYGTLVAARAASSLPIDKLALYDPVMAFPGGPPTDWVPSFERYLAAGDLPRGLAVMNRAMRNGGPLSGLPVAVQVPLARLFLKTPIGRAFEATSPTMAPEVNEVIARSGAVSDYAVISADTLVAAGARGPGYFVTVARALAEAIPNARFHLAKGAVHNAPNVGRPSFAAPFGDFFAGIPAVPA